MYDGQNVEGMHRNCYGTNQIEALHPDITTALAHDMTSPELEVTAIVEDSIHLLFWYRLSSGRGNILISPASFVDDYLVNAMKYKRPNKGHTYLNGVSGIDQIPCESIFTACGEGHFPQTWLGEGLSTIWVGSGPKVIMRPHCGNVLGRCAAIATSPQPIALLDQKKDLEIFARVFNRDRFVYGKSAS